MNTGDIDSLNQCRKNQQYQGKKKTLWRSQTKKKTFEANKHKHKNIASTRPTQPLDQGAWEVDQQWIISEVKQCSQHLN